MCISVFIAPDLANHRRTPGWISPVHPIRVADPVSGTCTCGEIPDNKHPEEPAFACEGNAEKATWSYTRLVRVCRGLDTEASRCR